MSFAIIKKSGASFTYGDVKLGQGFDNAKNHLKENQKLRDEIMQKVHESAKQKEKEKEKAAA